MLHFVDDFGSVETDDLADSGFSTTQKLGGALGFRFKPSKAQPPATRHKIQGVTVTLEDGEATIAMTVERAERIDAHLRQVLLTDQLSPKEASSLAGKLRQPCDRSISGRKQLSFGLRKRSGSSPRRGGRRSVS